ncbi:MAG: 16S rRNA (cytosine(1402)-N(4))-methyltransferase RsmH [Oscillospiraceae bacterium]|jgi:16S rRNA (cytosine1402-N4)-methyltransferase|nr:16S rRNA (cytosine(1402)-N(4))-methyltransferase RsmH [Oscillospiraceae bacterium]
MESFSHIPVMLNETLDLLNVRQGGAYLDGTFGGGGHSQELIRRGGQVTAIDRDADAVQVAARLKIPIIRGNFAEILPTLTDTYDGMLFDLGVSSHQLDTAERGFSFRRDAPLDMRMDQSSELSAYTIVNEWPYEELKRIFYAYGEERYAPQIARRILEYRERKPIETTLELTELLKSHPKRVFQALRIAVNNELSSLEQMLEIAPEHLNPGGVIAIITFHSLEDRIVKNAFRADGRLQVLTKHPLTASDQELAANPRSSSAKLRAAKKKEG